MINIGLVGYGYWGPNLARNFNASPDCKLLMIADMIESRRKVASSYYPGVDVVAEGMEIIEAKDVDVIAIATPVSTHYELAKKALKKGKHVLVEKPMTNNVEDAEELINLANKKKKILAVDHTFLYNGAVRKIKEIVNSRELGKVHYFDSVRINLGLFQHDVNVVWDLASHDISIMDYILEERPKEISVFGASHSRTNIEDIAYLNFKFEDEFIAHIHVNWLAPTKVRRTIIGGSKKMLIYDDLDQGEKVKIYDKGVIFSHPDKSSIYKALVQYRTGDMYAPYVDRTEPLKLEVAHFIDCILHNKKPLTDGKCGLRLVKILVAAQKSIKNNGQVIKL